MSQQLDWVGHSTTERKKAFKDIRNTRDAVAEEKAKLCLQLGELVNKVPPKLKSGGSVNAVRDWKRDREACLKIAGNKRSSAQELRSAINRMQPWF